ncbi:unnamed protein product [Chrysoparadoxa australica]
MAAHGAWEQNYHSIMRCLNRKLIALIMSFISLFSLVCSFSFLPLQQPSVAQSRLPLPLPLRCQRYGCEEAPAVDRREVLKQTLAILAASGSATFAAEEEAEEPKLNLSNRVDTAGVRSSDVLTGAGQGEITSRAFFDLKIGEEPASRLVIALYGKAVPETVANFESLVSSGAYEGTTVYKVLKGLNMQVGAVGDASGRSGRSSLPDGAPFPPENFSIPHSIEGTVSMVKGLDNMYDSRFWISPVADAGWADGKYVAFGRVVEGMDLVRKIDAHYQSGRNKPETKIVIEACGML